MIELTTLTAQTIAAGGTVTFENVSLHTGCGEYFNAQVPNSVRLSGAGGVYDIEFSGNITANAAATPVQLSLAASNFPLAATNMNATPAAAGDLANIHTSTFLRNPCSEAYMITVVNNGTNPVVLAPGANLKIGRRS